MRKPYRAGTSSPVLLRPAMWRNQRAIESWDLQPQPAWFNSMGGLGDCAELGFLGSVSQKGFCLGAWKESAGLCGYIAKVKSNLPVAPPGKGTHISPLPAVLWVPPPTRNCSDQLCKVQIPILCAVLWAE